MLTVLNCDRINRFDHAAIKGLYTIYSSSAIVPVEFSKIFTDIRQDIPYTLCKYRRGHIRWATNPYESFMKEKKKVVRSVTDVVSRKIQNQPLLYERSP